MSKPDYHTSTVSGARAHAERHAEYEPDDRPTKADCDREAAEERWRAERQDALDAVTDSLSQLEEVDEDAALQIQDLITDLEKNP
jgi:hypothetical protein